MIEEYFQKHNEQQSVGIQTKIVLGYQFDKKILSILGAEWLGKLIMEVSIENKKSR